MHWFNDSKLKLHIESQNETYFEHLIGATSISFLLGVLSIQCLIHSVFPFLFTSAVSDNIKEIERLCKRKQ